MHKPAVGRPSSRERILDAAADLVTEIGAGRLTLEAVADRAGLSKGGLLYSFPTKLALLRGMVERLIERGQADKERLRQNYAEKRNVEACVSIAAYLDSPCGRGDPVTKGLIAALSEEPSLLEPLRRKIAEHWDALKRSSDDAEAATIAWLAVEGLRSLELHDLSPIDESDRARVTAALSRLLERGIR